MIRYVRFIVSLHGLQLNEECQVDELREKIETAVRKIHPSLRFDSDVEVEIEEQAGQGEH